MANWHRSCIRLFIYKLFIKTCKNLTKPGIPKKNRKFEHKKQNQQDKNAQKLNLFTFIAITAKKTQEHELTLINLVINEPTAEKACSASTEVAWMLIKNSWFFSEKAKIKFYAIFFFW